MKRSKRINTILLAVTVVWTTVLAGCASGESEVTSGGNGTTVTFWHGSTDVEQEALEEIVKAFNEQQSDVTVEAVYIAQQGEGQNEKLLAAIAGGNPPDVAYFDRFEVGSWAAQGSLTDLTEYADQRQHRRQRLLRIRDKRGEIRRKTVRFADDTEPVYCFTRRPL